MQEPSAPNPKHGASINLDDLFTVEDLAAKHARLLTVGMLRWQLRHRKTNGLEAACVRLGGKVLISQSRYEAWLATRAERAA